MYPLNIAAFMVIRDDEYYAPMAIQSVLPFVRGIYVQEQMSTDGTFEELMNLRNKFGKDKIFVERVDTGTPVRFHPDYDEPKFRTLAVMGAEHVFKPDWILKIDADDLFTPYFFQRVGELLSKDFPFEGVIVSGDRPVSKDYWSTHGVNELHIDRISPEGGKFGDPHLQLWRANQGYYYINNPNLTGHFHPVLTPTPDPVYWLPGLCNIHLHRTFGPKAYEFWQEGGEKIDRSKPFLPPRDTPNWYNSDVNMATAEKRDFEWPEYVLSKWENWEGGVW